MRGHRWRVGFQNLGDQTRVALSLERLLSRQHLVENRTESEDVGARVRVLALELFGGHVLERAQNRALRRERES